MTLHATEAATAYLAEQGTSGPCPAAAPLITNLVEDRLTIRGA